MNAPQSGSDTPRSNERWLERLDFLWLELTARCNLECVHCYADSSPRIPLSQGMSYHKWATVLREGSALGCRKVQFIGGEPTLYPDLTQLVRDASMMGYNFIEVYTNGTRLTDHLLDSFRSFRVSLAFSMYGSRPEVHDRVTQRIGSHRKTLEGIRRALSYGIPVRASIIELQVNADDVDATRNVLQALQVESIASDHVRRIGRAQAGSDPLPELCGACWRGQLAIDARGNASPCVFARFCTVGNVSSGLRTVLRDARLHRFRLKVREHEETGIGGRSVATCKPSCAPYVATGAAL